MDEFLTHYETKPEYTESLDIIMTILDLIANEEGPRDKFFRFENAADALPSPNTTLKKLGLGLPDENLRLYVFRLSETAIIILGGGDKGTVERSVQNSKASILFYGAQTFSDRIQRLKNEGALGLDEDGTIHNIEDIIF